MAKGGARNRSGKALSMNSERALSLGELPPGGYTGKPPEWPLIEPTEEELALWLKAWAWPQGAKWATDEWRWPGVAMWVRQFIKCQAHDARPTDLAALHRFADQVGLTTAGLTEMGWKIVAEDQTPAAPVELAIVPRRLRKA